MSDVLIPNRDFEYIYMPFEILEESQCGTCVFRKQESEDTYGSMCYEIESKILEESNPIPEITNFGKGNIVCTKYKEGDPTPPQVDGQLDMF